MERNMAKPYIVFKWGYRQMILPYSATNLSEIINLTEAAKPATKEYSPGDPGMYKWYYDNDNDADFEISIVLIEGPLQWWPLEAPDALSGDTENMDAL
jgi:hypothetical protein